MLSRWKIIIGLFKKSSQTWIDGRIGINKWLSVSVVNQGVMQSSPRIMLKCWKNIIFSGAIDLETDEMEENGAMNVVAFKRWTQSCWPYRKEAQSWAWIRWIYKPKDIKHVGKKGRHFKSVVEYGIARVVATGIKIVKIEFNACTKWVMVIIIEGLWKFVGWW